MDNATKDKYNATETVTKESIHAVSLHKKVTIVTRKMVNRVKTNSLGHVSTGVKVIIQVNAQLSR